MVISLQFPKGVGRSRSQVSSWLASASRLNTKPPSLPSPALGLWLLGLAGCFAVFVSVSAEQ